MDTGNPKRPTVGSAATATDQGIDTGADRVEVPQKVAGPVGAAAGTASGAMIGTVILGPPGTIIGAIAGALGGWWAGHAAATAATEISEEDDRTYRSHYESLPNRLADRSYENVRPAYHLGHLAAAHPEYKGREWEAIEADLQKGWTDDLRLRHGDWGAVRGYAREAYARRTTRTDARSAADSSLTTAAGAGGGSWGTHLAGQPTGQVDPAVGADMGGTPSHQRPSFSDPVAAVADHVAGGVDPDGRVERIADSADPNWMEQPAAREGRANRTRRAADESSEGRA